MIVVDAKSPYKTLADLTAAMKAKGDKATYATASPIQHDHGRNLQEHDRRAGGRGTYKTAPDSLNEMLSGKLDYGTHDPVFALRAAARRPDAHSGRLHRHAACRYPGPPDHD